MSLLSALNTGHSGLETSSQELSVIGDNIANANTVGFKASRAVFQETLARTVIGQGQAQIGLGSRLQGVQRILSQGALTTTNRGTDVAIEGNGLFMVKGTFSGRDATYYTRNGQFTIDKDGYMTSLTGLRVQGYPADSTGTLQKTVGDLQVGTATASPRATTAITVRANLDAGATTPAAAWNVAQASATSNYSVTTQVYDSLGEVHQVDIYFRKTGAGAWDWHAVTDGGGLTGGTAGTATEIANGTLTYGANGQLTAMTSAGGPFNPLGATNPQPLTFNFGTSTGASGTGLDGITQFASPSASNFLSQDGYAAGDLTSINVDAEGQLVGSFNNGQTRVLGQLAIADFPAEDQLERVGGNLFLATPSAGQPAIGAPGAGGHGGVVSGTLEQSNVDMAGEFVRMIAAQRAFQANSKTLTTADQLLAELMTVKR
jgi:flagellar hook protein FlgE